MEVTTEACKAHSNFRILEDPMHMPQMWMKVGKGCVCSSAFVVWRYFHAATIMQQFASVAAMQHESLTESSRCLSRG